MAYTKKTGGVKEFHYTKEDLKRIESEDTEYTKAFKEGLKEHYANIKSGFLRKKHKEHHHKKDPIQSNNHKKKHKKHHIEDSEDYIDVNARIQKVREKDKLRKQKSSIWKMTLIFIIVLLVILGLILLSNESDVDDKVVKKDSEVITNKTITELVPQTISISKFIEEKAALNRQTVSVKGYLHHKFLGDSSGGSFSKRVIDDFGNELELVIIGKDYLDLFEKNKISPNLYDVRGTFQRGYDISKIRVTKIQQIEKPMKEATRVVSTDKPKEDSQIPDQINLEKESKKKIMVDIGKKIYSDIKSRLSNYTQETKEITNTKLNEIKDLTKECPVGYVNHWGDCVKTCTDKTIYGECSDNKPYYCEGGTLVKKASICGCPYPDSVLGDSCVSIVRAIEKKILLYTNEQRKSNGLTRLELDDKISSIARAHSEDMVTRDYFSHVNPSNEDPSARASRMGFNKIKQLGGGMYTQGVAENIGIMPTGNVEGVGYISNNAEEVAQAQVNSWMNSPGHRANILNPQYSHLGVGVDYDGLYYVSTQNFW